MLDHVRQVLKVSERRAYRELAQHHSTQPTYYVLSHQSEWTIPFRSELIEQTMLAHKFLLQHLRQLTRFSDLLLSVGVLDPWDFHTHLLRRGPFL